MNRLEKCMRINIVNLKGLDGLPMRVPKMENGEVVRDDTGNIVLREATNVDMIDLLIFNISPQFYTRQDSIHSGNIYNQAHTAKDGVMDIAEAEYNWLIKKLRDDNIGPKIFRSNLILVENSFTDDTPEFVMSKEILAKTQKGGRK